MKKIKLSYCILIVILSSSFTYAQKRKVDLKVRILNYKDKDFVKSDGSITLQYSLYNQGPDKILAGDSLYIYGSFYDSAFKPDPLYAPLLSGIEVKDSIILSFKHSYSFQSDFNHFFISFTALPVNRNVTGLILEDLNMQKDNKSLISDLKYRSPTSGTLHFGKSIPLEIYPNPVKDICSIKVQNIEGDVNIKLLNNQGSTVQQWHYDQNNFFSDLNMKGIPNGVYSLFVENGSKLSCKKLVILH